MLNRVSSPILRKADLVVVASALVLTAVLTISSPLAGVAALAEFILLVLSQPASGHVLAALYLAAAALLLFLTLQGPLALVTGLLVLASFSLGRYLLSLRMRRGDVTCKVR